MPVGGAATQSLTRKLGKRQSEETEKKKSKTSTPTEKIDDVSVVTSVTPDDSFELPSPTLLKTGVAKKKSKAIESELAETAGRLQQTMADFGIMATVVDWVAGPTVTLFEVDLPPGVRVSRITNLQDDIALALAKGLGALRAGVFETTFDNETKTDLFGEQAVLCGGLTAMIKAGFQTLVDAGYPPEMAYFEVLHETKLITDMINIGGFEYMWHVVSNTAEYGGLTRRDRVITEESKKGMKSILADIESGKFKDEWRADWNAGLKDLKRMENEEKKLQLETVGKEIRSLFERKKQ